MDPKEIYIEELDRIQAELEDEGMPEAEAHAFAATRANDAMRDRFADMADRARQQAKDDRI
jgi:hypothetical protein